MDDVEQDLNQIHGVDKDISDLGGVSPVPTVTSTTSKKRVSAQFGRKRTHNKQILVAPCGIIIACETFFGVEEIATCAVSPPCLALVENSNSIKEFVKCTFHINGQQPNHLFF